MCLVIVKEERLQRAAAKARSLGETEAMTHAAKAGAQHGVRGRTVGDPTPHTLSSPGPRVRDGLALCFVLVGEVKNIWRSPAVNVTCSTILNPSVFGIRARRLSTRVGFDAKDTLRLAHDKPRASSDVSPFVLGATA